MLKIQKEFIIHLHFALILIAENKSLIKFHGAPYCELPADVICASPGSYIWFLNTTA